MEKLTICWNTGKSVTYRTDKNKAFFPSKKDFGSKEK